MKSSVSYDYASGDLLENRNSYFYTKFRGQKFLSAWRKHREEVLVEKINSCSAEIHAVNTPTEQLLETIWCDLSGQDTNSETLRSLDRLLQRFEVTKRLHGEYNEKWRPTNLQDYHGLERYVRFAEVLDLAYASTSELTYLNTLLKCMDTLTALRERLNFKQQVRLQILIVHERDHVEQLRLKIAKDSDAT